MADEKDVQNADVTAEDSSPEPNDQDTEDSVSDSQGADASPQTTDEQSVPYSRFKEVNDRLKKESESKAEYEQKLKDYESRLEPQDPRLNEVKQVLKQLGYVTRDEVEAELKQTREDAQLDLELSRLEGKYTGKDGLPKFDRQKVVDYAVENGISSPEAAYREMNFDKIIDYHVKSATGKTGGVKSEKSDGSGSSQAGVTDADLMEGVRKGDRSATHTLLRRISALKPDS